MNQLQQVAATHMGKWKHHRESSDLHILQASLFIEGNILKDKSFAYVLTNFPFFT